MSKKDLIVDSILHSILYQVFTLPIFLIGAIISAIANSHVLWIITFSLTGISFVCWALKAIIDNVKEYKKDLEMMKEEQLREEQEEKRQELFNTLNETIEIFKKETNKKRMYELINSITSISNQLNALHGFTDEILSNFHKDFLANIILDGKITTDEKEVLQYIENSFNLKWVYRSNRLEAYRIAYRWATKDKILTEAEEDILKNIYLQLEIDEQYVEDEQNLIKDLSLVRQLENKQLSPISTSFKLNNDEQCFFAVDNVSFHKSKSTEFGYEPTEIYELKGKIYVTNKRILIISPNDFSRWLRDIGNIEIYMDQYIKFRIGGKEKPFFIKTTKPYLLRMIILNFKNNI